ALSPIARGARLNREVHALEAGQHGEQARTALGVGEPRNRKAGVAGVSLEHRTLRVARLRGDRAREAGALDQRDFTFRVRAVGITENWKRAVHVVVEHAPALPDLPVRFRFADLREYGVLDGVWSECHAAGRAFPHVVPGHGG